jgi:hypothetical protein
MELNLWFRSFREPTVDIQMLVQNMAVRYHNQNSRLSQFRTIIVVFTMSLLIYVRQ